MTANTLGERVAAGAALLDQHWPDWWERADLDTLDVMDPTTCPAAQASGLDYIDALRAMRLEPLDPRVSGSGFAGPRAVDAEWRRLILARRAGAGVTS